MLDMKNIITSSFIFDQTEDIKEIALKAAALDKKNKNRERMVIITQGTEPTIVAFGRNTIFIFCSSVQVTVTEKHLQ